MSPLRGAAYGLVLFACSRSSPSPPPASSNAAASASDASIAIAPVDAGASHAESTDAASEDAAESGPYAELPPIDDAAERIVGFSKDDKYVGYAISTCDPCPLEFHFRGPGVAPIDLAYFWDPSLDENVAERRRKANDEKVDRKLKELGATTAAEGRKLRGPFPTDLVFRTKSEDGPRPGTKRVWVGARTRDRAEPVYPMSIVIGPHPMFDAMPAELRASMKGKSQAERDAIVKDWRSQWELPEPELAYVNVSKDGTEIAAVVFVTGTMWVDMAAIGRMKTDSFVAAVRKGP